MINSLFFWLLTRILWIIFFRLLDKARKENNKEEEQKIIAQIDNFETHIVPIVADIDAGFGNEEATYQLAKKMILAGACCIQMENQVC